MIFFKFKVVVEAVEVAVDEEDLEVAAAADEEDLEAVDVEEVNILSQFNCRFTNRLKTSIL